MTTIKKLSIAILLIFVGQGASAEVINQVSFSQGSAGVPGCGTAESTAYTSATTIEENLNDGSASCTMSMDGYAGGGVVGLRGTINQTPGTESINQIRAHASTIMTDIFIEPASGYDREGLEAIHGSVIPVTVNAAIKGALTAIIDTNSVFSRAANALVDAYVNLSGTSTRYLNSVGATNSVDLSSDADNFYELLSPTRLLDWNNPFTVEFSMGGSAGVSGYRDSFGTATFDAFNSLSFSSDGPAFILPPGFTVNALDLNIIDNRWVDPRAGNPDGPVVPVPSPATFPLMASGLALVGLNARRRKKQNPE